MEQRFLIAASCAYLRTGQFHTKLLSEKHLFPLGHDAGFVNSSSELQVKFYDANGRLHIQNDARLEELKGTFCLKLATQTFERAVDRLGNSSFLFVVIEGATERATVILSFAESHARVFETLDSENPALRLEVCDLPPSEVTVVDVAPVRAALYTLLATRHPELFSLNAQRFLATPHILTHLFAHVMSLSSAENISYISTLRVIADQLRDLLSSRIRKIPKDHKKAWHTFYGDRLSFLDGGVSRIVGLPGTEPMGIRVGVYTVIPGEREPEKRESWHLDSYVIGDVVNDRSIILDQNYKTDTKRLQEAARYILESLGALRHIKQCEKELPRLLLVHGPLQNTFVAYDENDPSYIPGVDSEFLSSVGISERDVTDAIEDIPRNRNGRLLWNGCIPIYLHIIKLLWSAKTPVIGVVERAASNSVTRAAIEHLVSEGRIPSSTGTKLKERVLQYEIGDELLFGCVLEEGEYLVPFEIQKNYRHRAHGNWQPVIEQFPRVSATMLKSSPLNFPYRVELTTEYRPGELDDQMNLLYHMSLLLPNYAFPAGIDIADKYVKVPDWLSKGVSERLTAGVLRKILESGDSKALMQVRRLLALSPRDFFYRPRA